MEKKARGKTQSQEEVECKKREERSEKRKAKSEKREKKEADKSTGRPEGRTDQMKGDCGGGGSGSSGGPWAPKAQQQDAIITLRMLGCAPSACSKECMHSTAAQSIPALLRRSGRCCCAGRRGFSPPSPSALFHAVFRRPSLIIPICLPRRHCPIAPTLSQTLVSPHSSFRSTRFPDSLLGRLPISRPR
ncbi:hypothetical protein CMQ_5410 [Grosmannia clavigera kw1407]|uniref:Uncharacterized protein n=1 Tax=Grosmannia clavigera (strain kw1407 / UAMH 11150) TaxID=655863 RepID=F0XFZ5_GROCL|nr:uncharacterized protein CMQ_5410 [Grosmannia clavigera kw1407]EFX03360.1 hypothetical protein CMQ_5410 [Grosmannia clavigera kw1407]